jgi:hypothetical protein
MVGVPAVVSVLQFEMSWSMKLSAISVSNMATAYRFSGRFTYHFTNTTLNIFSLPFIPHKNNNIQLIEQTLHRLTNKR